MCNSVSVRSILCEMSWCGCHTKILKKDLGNLSLTAFKLDLNLKRQISAVPNQYHSSYSTFTCYVRHLNTFLPGVLLYQNASTLARSLLIPCYHVTLRVYILLFETAAHSS